MGLFKFHPTEAAAIARRKQGARAYRAPRLLLVLFVRFAPKRPAPERRATRR